MVVEIVSFASLFMSIWILYWVLKTYSLARQCRDDGPGRTGNDSNDEGLNEIGEPPLP